MKAVILAGGKGTRLKPYTYVLPKPLVPVGEKPILALLLEKLKESGVKEVIFCVNQLAELIMAYFGNGEKFGIPIKYSREDQPLGTVAPLKLIPDLPDDFLVMNGDLMTDLNLEEIFQYHCSQKSLITVGVTQRKVQIDFGVLEMKNGIMTQFLEKPEYCYQVSMGIYVFNRRVLDLVPDQGPYGFDQLMLELLKRKEKVHVFPHTGFWLDLGRIEDFEKANEIINQKKDQLSINGGCR